MLLLLLLYDVMFVLLLLVLGHIIFKLFKVVHKRQMSLQGDTLTYNSYGYKTTITKRSSSEILQ